MAGAIAYGISALATATAIALATRRPQYRPVAAFLLVGLLADLGQRALALGPGPYVGVDRVLFHVRQALFLIWPMALRATFHEVFARPRRGSLLGAYLLVVVALVIGYPEVRSGLLGAVYLVGQLGVLATAGVCVARWWRSDEYMAPEHLALVVLGVVEVAAVVWGPWTRGLWNRWDLAVAAYEIGFGALVLLQGVSLWRSSRG